MFSNKSLIHRKFIIHNKFYDETKEPTEIKESNITILLNPVTNLWDLLIISGYCLNLKDVEKLSLPKEIPKGLTVISLDKFNEITIWNPYE